MTVDEIAKFGEGGRRLRGSTMIMLKRGGCPQVDDFVSGVVA
jgi:hypothetical protein